MKSVPIKDEAGEEVPQVVEAKPSQYRVRIHRTRTEARPVCIYREGPKPVAEGES